MRSLLVLSGVLPVFAVVATALVPAPAHAGPGAGGGYEQKTETKTKKNRKTGESVQVRSHA